MTSVDLSIPGWELDEVGPDGLIAVDGVNVSSGTVSIPLLQPTSGPMELLLRAHRTIEAGAASITVPLPQPHTSMAGPASLAVMAADNVELTPDNQAIEGLVRQRSVPAMKLPERQQEPLYYHGTGGAAVFAAGFHVYTQQINTDAAAQITIAEQMATVEQRLSYSVAYEPISRLTLAVPRSLATGKRFRVLHDGKPLAPVVVADESDGKDAMAPVPVRVTLPDPHIGAFDLMLQYALPIAEPKRGRELAISVPLAMPEDGAIVANSVVVKAARTTRVSLREDGWTIVNRDGPGSGKRGHPATDRAQADEPR